MCHTWGMWGGVMVEWFIISSITPNQLAALSSKLGGGGGQ